MPIANSDFVPDPFPGVSAGADTTGAAGSAGDRSSPGAVDLAGKSGLPGIGVTLPLGDQADPGSDTTTQPGQTDASVISPGPASDYASPGPRGGHAIVDDSYRYPWQQRAGGA